MPIEVRYNLAFGLVLLGGAVFVGLSGLVTSNLMLMGLGAMQVLIGLGFSTMPAFVVHPRRIEMKNILGMTLKTVEVPLSELEVRGTKLYRKGTEQALAGGFFTRASDLERVAAALPS